MTFRPEFQLRTDTFVLKGRRNNLSLNRFGFIVSKRIDKRAVVRNRTHRAYRQCVENIQPISPGGYDMLFVARKLYKKEDQKHFCEMLQAEVMKQMSS